VTPRVEGLLIAIVLGGVLIPPLRRVEAQRLRALGLCAVVALCTTLVWSSAYLPRSQGVPVPAEDTRPLESPQDGYVTSQECRSCHPGPHASWSRSYHRRMAELATSESVLGDFDAGQLEFYGRTYGVERREGDQFWVGVPSAGGLAWHQVVQTTGSHTMQVYWFATGEQRTLDQFPLVYLLQERRWAPRNSAFLRPPALQQDPPPETSRWNRTCVLCHATHPRSRMTGPTTADTAVAELGIACESCHGPGEEHVRANRDPLQRYMRRLRDERDPTIVNPAKLPHDRSTQVCGQCHSVFYSKSQEDYTRALREGFRFRPGDELEETRHVVRCEPDPTQATPIDRQLRAMFPGYMQSRFWSDGMIRVAGREYNALLESPCYQRGELSCLDCHVLHQPTDDTRPALEWADDQLQVGRRGDAACADCHAELAADVEAHTFHPPSSAGSECMNCHMPHTAYALQKAVRSHTVDSPRVATELATGRPNACNLCHLDRSLGWTAEQLAERYGHERPALTDDQAQVPAGVRWLLTGDAALRALTAWSLGWAPAREASGEGWIPGYLAETFDDPYDSVRFIGARSLRALPGYAELEFDPLGSPAERRAAQQRVREQWRRAGLQPGPGFPHDERGELLPDYTRLLGLRDTRPVDLVE